MIVVNFSHPLSEGQQAQLVRLTGRVIERLVEQPAHFVLDRPFGEQAAALVEQVGLTPRAWQQETLLVRLPALNGGSVAVLAELHGRCGYFPSVVRLRLGPPTACLLPRYEVAEVMPLQAIREQARRRR